MDKNNNAKSCVSCSAKDFEAVNGSFFCTTCGSESLQHGKDFVYEETYKLKNHNYEDIDSNDENHPKNDYPDDPDEIHEKKI